MCWHWIVNSYDYYCHLLRSNIRYWQELLMILTGCLAFVGYIIHITHHNDVIAGKILIYACGPLFVVIGLWYCCTQFRYKILSKYFLFESRTHSLSICTIGLMAIEINVAAQLNSPVTSYLFILFCAFGVFVFIGMDTANNVSLILYIFYPLTIAVACCINVIRSFSWATIIIHSDQVHELNYAQIDRLLQAQICLTTFYAFIFAIKNPTRKYFVLLTKRIPRFNMVHESTKYESMKKLSLILQITWLLIATLLLVYEYTDNDIKFIIFDYGIVIVLFINTLLLIYIEFDRKVTARLVTSQRGLILIVCMCVLLVAQCIVLAHVATKDYILVSLNEFFWKLAILYLIFIDGFRNCRLWHRIYVYAVFVFKSVTMMARTAVDWIDNTLYPEPMEWFKQHPRQREALDNLARFGWYFVCLIAAIGFFHIVADPEHQYFILALDKMPRDETNDDDYVLFRKSTALKTPTPAKRSGASRKQRRRSMRKASKSGTSGIGHGGGLVIEARVESEKDMNMSINNHSVLTDASGGSTYQSLEQSYGYKTLLKMDL